MTVGGAMSGYCATGRIVLATSAGDHDDDRDDSGEHGTVDEELREHVSVLLSRGGGVADSACVCDDRDARFQLHQVVDDHRVAGVQSLG